MSSRYDKYPEVTLNDNQRILIEKMFFIKDPVTGKMESWKELCIRVAKHVAAASVAYGDRNIEDEEEEYFKMMYYFKFVAATPILMNAGTAHPQLFSCFVMDIEDDLMSIYDALKTAARIFSRAGGVGFRFSNIRPAGQKAGVRAESAGVLAFMGLFNSSCDIIKATSEGRRGAMLAALEVNHPEIIDFIRSKRNTKKNACKFENFNNSVVINDEFMAAVKMDGKIALKEFTPNESKKMVSAQKIFKALVKNAWEKGEPGVLFMDTANKFNPTPSLGKFISSNPCLSGESLLLTESGYKRIDSLVGKTRIVDSDGNVVESDVFESGVKPAVSVNFTNGKHIICTPDHRFKTDAGFDCEAKDLDGKCLSVFTKTITNFDPLFVKLGFIQGDAELTRLNSTIHKGFAINLGKNDQDVIDLFGYTPEDFDKDGRRVYTSEFFEICKDLEFEALPLPERRFPHKIFDQTDAQRLSFLRGLYSANGSLINVRKTSKGRISLKTTCKGLVKDVTAELSYHGINSYVTTNKSKPVKFSNGEYVCKESYDINIGKFEDICKFNMLIGFVQEYKAKQLLRFLSCKNPMVRSVRPLPEPIKVYDFTSPVTHYGVVQQFITHNCGEVIGSDGAVCVLGHVNLANLLDENGNLNWDEFEARIRSGIRFLDNCLDINQYPTEKFERHAKATRTIGLGFTGLADLLCQMDIVYGSDECYKFLNKFGSFFQNISHDESLKIAEKRGVYPAFEGKTPLRRNASTNTIAPSGTTSQVVNVFNGMEPMFGVSYTKLCFDKKTKFVYKNQYLADKMRKAGYSEDKIEQTMEHTIKTGKMPDDLKAEFPAFIMNLEISPRDRIKTQAILQKYIDLSISGTVIFPRDATVEDVAEIYMMAWEYGLKGITAYRDGSISDQPIIAGDGTRNTWNCPGCGNIMDLDEGVDPDKICIKCPRCNYKSCS